MATLKLGADIYTVPPKTAIPGARTNVHGTGALAVADLQSTTQLVAVGILPAGHWLTDFALETPAALDSGTPALVVSVGILNSYYNKPIASAANPGTDSGTTPALVSGQNILTTNASAYAAGRILSALPFTSALGVDYVNDRIIAIQFTTGASAGVQAGSLNMVLTIDAAN